MASGIEAMAFDDRRVEIVAKVYREALIILRLEFASSAVRELLAISVLRHSRHCNDASSLLEATLAGFFVDPVGPEAFDSRSALLAAE